MRTNIPIILSLLLLPWLAVSQPGSTDPCGVPTLTTLLQPSGCGYANRSVQGPITGTTIGMGVEKPQPVCNCGPGVNFRANSKDTWWMFQAKSSYVNIKIDSFFTQKPLDTAQIALYHYLGSCKTMLPIGCARGVIKGKASKTFNVIKGQFYALQIASHPKDSGMFKMFIESFDSCNVCVKSQFLSVSPRPVNGVYPPDTYVEFCYSVSAFDSMGGNHLHGVVPEFGPGWDVNTFQDIGHTISNDGQGVWDGDTIQIGGTGPFVRGYFYDRLPNLDGNPTNNRGDDGGNTGFWVYCWTIKTGSSTVCQQGKDLHVRVQSYTDNQSGSTTVNDCPLAEPMVMRPIMNCCDGSRLEYYEWESCLDSCDGEAGVRFLNTMVGEFTWYNPGDTVLRQVHRINGDTLTGICNSGNGEHVLIVNDSMNSCFFQRAFKMITDTGRFNVKQTDTSCVGDCQISAIAVPVDTAFNFYSWRNVIDSSLHTGKKQDSLCQGLYEVTAIKSATGCAVKRLEYFFGIPKVPAIFYMSNSPPAWQFFFCSADKNPLPIGFPGAWSSIPPGYVNPTTGELNLKLATQKQQVYIIHQTGLASCIDMDTTAVTILPSPPPPQPGKAAYTICNSDSGMYLTATSGGAPIFWYSDSALTNQLAVGDSLFARYPGAVPALYYLASKKTDLLGTCYSTRVPVIVTGLISDISAGPDKEACPGFILNLEGSGGTTYNWSPGTYFNDSTVSDPQVQLDSTMKFYLFGVDSNGCKGIDSVMVVISDNGNCSDVVLYTGFSPNDDGKNDTWIINGINRYPVNYISIFNRWGTEVWGAENYNNRDVVWKGQDYNGNRLTSGTYYYVLGLGEQKPLTGWVEITR